MLVNDAQQVLCSEMLEQICYGLVTDAAVPTNVGLNVICSVGRGGYSIV